MSELLDKQVNVQKESLKQNFRGSHELLQAHEKVCNEMKESRRKKNDCRVKKIFVEGKIYKAVSEDWLIDFDELQVIDSSKQ